MRTISRNSFNQHFNHQAIEEAKALGVKLWDRDKLNEMIGRVNK